MRAIEPSATLEARFAALRDTVLARILCYPLAGTVLVAGREFALFSHERWCYFIYSRQQSASRFQPGRLAIASQRRRALAAAELRHLFPPPREHLERNPAD